MHANTPRAGRFVARLNLETLEGRALPSATLPAPLAPAPAAAAALQAPAALDTAAEVAAVARARAAFSTNWSTGTSAVLTGTNAHSGDGRGTGTLAFALARPRAASAAISSVGSRVPVGLLVTSSSASALSPDHYNATITLRLRIHDAASGKWGVLAFRARVTGNLSYGRSSLTVTFEAPTQRVVVGNKLYTATLPKTVHPGAPGTSAARLFASIQVSPRPAVRH